MSSSCLVHLACAGACRFYHRSHPRRSLRTGAPFPPGSRPDHCFASCGVVLVAFRSDGGCQCLYVRNFWGRTTDPSAVRTRFRTIPAWIQAGSLRRGLLRCDLLVTRDSRPEHFAGESVSSLSFSCSHRTRDGIRASCQIPGPFSTRLFLRSKTDRSASMRSHEAASSGNRMIGMTKSACASRQWIAPVQDRAAGEVLRTEPSHKSGQWCTPRPSCEKLAPHASFGSVSGKSFGCARSFQC